MKALSAAGLPAAPEGAGLGVPFERAALLRELSENGFAHFEDIEFATFKATMQSLGKVMYITDVKANKSSRALVTSLKHLDFHTDHHKADLVSWYCLQQAREGGESILLDTWKVLAHFTEEEKAVLADIHLFEHKIFDGDVDSYPLLSRIGGRTKVYYSFWLANDDMKGRQKAVFSKFKEVTHELEPVRLRLHDKGVLVVDNSRILHGRTAITGDRFLKRYWLSCPELRAIP